MAGQASKEFWDAFTGGGSPAMTCVCGRHYIAAGHESGIGETELEEANEAANAPNSKTYVRTLDDSIGYIDLGDRIIVYGCHCGSDLAIERFLRINMEQIIKYYKLRQEATRQAAETQASLLNSL